MTVTQWIILAAVVVVLLLVILLLVGLARRKKNTISFEEKKAPEELTQAEKSGNYQATGGFNFASAAPAPTKKPEKQPDLLPGQELGATPPAPPAPPASTSVRSYRSMTSIARSLDRSSAANATPRSVSPAANPALRGSSSRSRVAGASIIGSPSARR